MRFVPSLHLLAHLRAACEPSAFPNAQRRLFSRIPHPSLSSRPYKQCFHSSCILKEGKDSLRKQINDEAKARKRFKKKESSTSTLPGHADDLSTQWQLTVGIEIHAELNTQHKLFSNAQTSLSDAPNTHVAAFDSALPGAQPQFQYATLLPALRAALAFGCKIMNKSTWDRKHYFWWDQPNGYQITQYYEPFAKDGMLTLYPHDDIDPSDYPFITIGIKQIQMEQDTAKTTLQPPSTHLLDFNRVSHPLIEIITLPQIHNPKTAAAVVKKVQAILKAVDANTTGMEMGGLRADINVSVRNLSNFDNDKGMASEYAGIQGLGQRTEIKNLSSFKAVEDAIIAEKKRQISILEAGGIIEGETRGWTLGSTETRKIRGKEGEIDYRYMPDPDLPAVIIGQDILDSLDMAKMTLPDDSLNLLTDDATSDLTIKDAKTLVVLDDGARLDYFLAVNEQLDRWLLEEVNPIAGTSRKTCANWILHEFPSALTKHDLAFSIAVEGRVSSFCLARILYYLLKTEITLPTAKSLLDRATSKEIAKQSRLNYSSNSMIWDDKTIDYVLDQEGLKLQPMSKEDYTALAHAVVNEYAEMAEKVRKEEEQQWDDVDVKTKKKKGGKGKIMWFVGQMVKKGEDGRVQPELAERAVREALRA